MRPGPGMKSRVPGHANPGMHEVLQRGVSNAETFPANQKLGLCCARDLAHFNRRSTITEDQFPRDGAPLKVLAIVAGILILVNR